MNSYVFRRIFILGFFLAHWTFPAFSVDELDFQIAGLDEKWKQLHPSIQSKIIYDENVKKAFGNFQELNNLLGENLSESNSVFLDQVIQIESHRATGEQQQQDQVAISGFQHQVEKTLDLRNEFNTILYRLSDQFFPLSEEDKIRLNQIYIWLINNLPKVEALRKNIAHYFFISRIGYNPQHQNSIEELVWNAQIKIKTLNILENAFLMPEKFSDIGSCGSNTTKNSLINNNILTRENLNYLYPALIADISEFQVEGSTIFNLKKIQEFKKHSHHLFSILWEGDNETASLPKTPLMKRTIQALRVLNKNKEIHNILRNTFFNKVFLLNLEGNNASKHQFLPQFLREIWTENCLGRPLNRGENIPHPSTLDLILEACQYNVLLTSILKNNELDQEKIGRLYNSIEARFPKHAISYKNMYMQAMREEATSSKQYSLSNQFAPVLLSLRSCLNLDEFENHPECIVWKLTQGPNPHASVLKHLEHYNERIAHEWLSKSSCQYFTSQPNFLNSDQEDFNYWTQSHEWAQKAIQTDETLTKKLRELDFDLFPFQCTRVAINKQTLTKTIYEVIRSLHDLAKQARDHSSFLMYLEHNRALLNSMKTLCWNQDQDLKLLDKLPHWQKKFHTIKMIIETISDKTLHPSYRATRAFELSQSLSTYTQYMDLRYYDEVVRWWWTKRFAFSAFEGAKEYEDSLIFEQFYEVNAIQNIQPDAKINWLKKIWNTTEKKATIEEYLSPRESTSLQRSYSI